MAEESLHVTTVINEGNLEVRVGQTFEEILTLAAEALDRACAHEICGDVLFRASDGRYYTATTEIVISEANPDSVREEVGDVST